MSIVAIRMNNNNVKTLKVPLNIFLVFLLPIICSGTFFYNWQICPLDIPFHQQDKEYSLEPVKTRLATGESWLLLFLPGFLDHKTDGNYKGNEVNKRQGRIFKGYILKVEFANQGTP